MEERERARARRRRRRRQQKSSVKWHRFIVAVIVVLARTWGYRLWFVYWGILCV